MEKTAKWDLSEISAHEVMKMLENLQEIYIEWHAPLQQQQLQTATTAAARPILSQSYILGLRVWLDCMYYVLHLKFII